MRFTPGRLTWVDVAVVAWTGVCVALGVALAGEVRQLGRYGDTTDQTAAALDEIAAALFLVSALPFLGDDVRDVGVEIAATAALLRQNASDTRSSAADLSLLLALAVSIVPTVPAIAIHLSHRIELGGGYSSAVRDRDETAPAGLKRRST